MLQSNTHGSRVIVLGVALLLLVVVVALPRVVAAEKRVHIVFATYHYTGHVVPMMALAKELATKHRDARFAKDVVKRELSRYGIEFISMGRLPWTSSEESLMIAELPEKGFFEKFATMRRIGGTTERVSTEALIQRFSSEKPDFLVIDPMASGAVNAADKFSIPYMYMHTSGLPMVDGWNSFFLKNPANVAPILGPNLGPLSIHSVFDRIKAKAAQFLLDTVMIFTAQANRNRLRESFGLPPVRGLFRSSDIPNPILLASSWALSPATTLPPYVQLVGAVYDPSVSPAAPPSPELIQWLDAADRPIVYVSTGTVARLAADQLFALAEAMNSLPEYNFLWSFKKDKYAVALPAMQQHVRIEDFVPQARVLQHNNTLVFLSHCGQNSMLEAISTGTPILALPLIGDQFHNARMLVENGAALALDPENITTSSLADALNALSQNETFAHNMDLLQALLEIAGGKERAGEWVWLTARHGYEHLVPKELTVNWFLYHELDVPLNLFLIASVILCTLYGVYRLIKWCLCACFRRRRHEKSD